MNWLDLLSTKVGLNNEAKFGFLLFSITNIPPLAGTSIFWGVATYHDLKEAVRKQENRSRSFSTTNSSTQANLTKWFEMQ